MPLENSPLVVAVVVVVQFIKYFIKNVPKFLCQQETPCIAQYSSFWNDDGSVVVAPNML